MAVVFVGKDWPVATICVALSIYVDALCLCSLSCDG